MRGLHQARNLYSALVSHPACQQLRFESTLLRTKRQWNASAPTYDRFYNLHPILMRLQSAPSPISEGEVRLRVIVLLRLLCLFRGCDLHTARRNIDRSAQPWMLQSRRKGRVLYGATLRKYPSPPTLGLQRGTMPQNISQGWVPTPPGFSAPPPAI